MPTFRITAPDGKDYEITAPEGATEQEALTHFQANWKPEAAGPAQASYSNEGHNRPAKKDEPKPSILRQAIDTANAPFKWYGKQSYDALVGMAKGTRDLMESADKTILDMAPTRTEGVVDPKYKSDESQTTNEMYKEAGPAALGGRIISDLALTGGPSTKAATATMGALKTAPRVLRNALGGAAGGSTGGALGGVGEDETRGGNALQGAALGSFLGAAAGEIPGALRATKEFLGVGGADSALNKAYKYFQKALGPGVNDSVRNNLDLPRNLPMSTAAATGSDELGSLERISRATADPRANSRWSRLDGRTNRAANEAMNDATSAGDDLLRLEPQVREALRPAQEALNGIKVSPGERKAFASQIMELANDPLFRLSAARPDLTRLAAAVQSPKANLGELAEFQTSLGANNKMTGPQKARLIEIIDETIAAKDGGMWRQALGRREALAGQLDQADAANSIRNKFTGEYGEIVGKPTAGLPTVTGDKLEGAMRTQGTDRADKFYPVDRLTPQNRDALTELVGELRRAEGPRVGKGGTVSKDTPWGSIISDARGNPIPGANYWLFDLLRKGVEKAGIKGGQATMKAADAALRNPRVWERMVESNSKITASDAKMMADILRRTSAASGVAVTDKGE